MLELAGMTVTGPVREKNEDRLLINRQVIRTGSLSLSLDDSCLAAVFDGVGGEAYGAEAAEPCFVPFVMDPADDSGAAGGLAAQNKSIPLQQTTTGPFSPLHVKLRRVLLPGDDVFAFNIGDSNLSI